MIVGIIMGDTMSRHGSFLYLLGLARRPFCPVGSFRALVTLLFTLPPHWNVFIDTLCLLCLFFARVIALTCGLLWRIVGFVVLLLGFLVSSSRSSFACGWYVIPWLFLHTIVLLFLVMPFHNEGKSAWPGNEVVV